ncbi:hypothetical protein HELRODRAFT_173392 [Helobdella robusta]|uniref:C-type lectin domain-containing protein n=1 Tax=Helobdella robusta TaxID=6412 RepID=T1F6R8_HELRO|nr:hypothetical protein HELRODRAFT_173392 [Helobdella robusta]ESO03693.1 hypothetical protein HELRODRAFT_173392 [Helobdella robusta]
MQQTNVVGKPGSHGSRDKNQKSKSGDKGSQGKGGRRGGGSKHGGGGGGKGMFRDGSEDWSTEGTSFISGTSQNGGWQSSFSSAFSSSNKKNAGHGFGSKDGTGFQKIGGSHDKEARWSSSFTSGSYKWSSRGGSGVGNMKLDLDSLLGEKSFDEESWTVVENKTRGGIADVPVDWNEWSEWTQQANGTSVRTRTCKNAPKGLCRGPNKQTRMRTETWVESSEEWSEESSEQPYDETEVRTFKALRRKGHRGGKGHDQDSEDSDESWSYEVDFGNMAEVLEDWEVWSDWVQGADGWWQRTRKCKNQSKNGPCRGKVSQRRKKKVKIGGRGRHHGHRHGSHDGGDSSGHSWSYEADKAISVVEVLEDWEVWSEWVQGADGWWQRTRKCKNQSKNGPCRGKVSQRRRKKVRSGGSSSSDDDDSGSWSISIDKDEVKEDWLEWGEWILDVNGIWTRTRKCKNVGKDAKCRGKTTQTRRKKKKTRHGKDDPFKRSTSHRRDKGKHGHGSRDFSDSWSYENQADFMAEVLEDWEVWGEWIQGADGWWQRMRKCKNQSKNGPCRGKVSQRRRKKMKGSGNSDDDDSGSWSISIDKDEVKEDWLEWGEWILDVNGIWTRTRKCKNVGKDAKCRGKTTQTRRKKKTRHGSKFGDGKSHRRHKGKHGHGSGSVDESWSYEVQTDTIAEIAEDWEVWGEWVQGADGWWQRTRKCKNQSKNGPCRGKVSQKRKKKVKGSGSGSGSSDNDDSFSYTVDKDEVKEDWYGWGEWMVDAFGVRTRTRKCKNVGKDAKCRGKATQARLSKRKHGSESIDSSGSIEITNEPTSPENLEDWNEWSQWEKDADDFWVRKRVCKNALSSGKCRGACIQKKKEIITTTTTIKITKKRRKNSCADDEVLKDWFLWGEWKLVGTIWTRTRVCKNDGITGICRGKSVETSKTDPKVTPTDDEYNNDLGLDNLEEVPKPIDGGWSPWEDWSPLTGTKNPETQTRKRKCDNPEPGNGGKKCNGSDTDSKQVYSPIDGKWSDWTEWSRPVSSSTKIYRTRVCNKPPPSNNGKYCSGNERDEKDVIFPTDGKWEEWSPWSTPTFDSNPETLTRTRHCTNPAPSNGGADCSGPDQDTKQEYHPIDGGWSEWTPWAFNGTEEKRRDRTCTNPKPEYFGKLCAGPSFEIVHIILPTNGGWSNWGPWSELTHLTNPETIYRKRVCDHPTPANGGAYCEGNDQDKEDKYTPIDGSWKEWGQWSDANCKSDEVQRVRECKPPMFNGKDCVGPKIETKPITRPVDGNWGDWGEWIDLFIQTYQLNPKTVYRKRFCDSPSPSNGGSECIGPSTDRTDVYTPVNGGWNEWSEWKLLHELGKKSRYRTCSNPAPLYGGSNCNGFSEELEDLIEPKDGNWSPWSVWSTPTGLFNPETIRRTRSCDNPSPVNGGKDCEGFPEDTYTIEKPIDGGWSEWTEWTLTPDKKYQEHNRTCTNPSPLFGGKNCVGVEFEAVEKPIDGRWSDWGEWSILTNATNPETIRRRRVCNNPIPFGGGKECSGLDIDEITIYRAVDGGWSDWSEWTPESESSMIRFRKCDNPAPLFGGLDCSGPNSNSKHVEHPTDGKWGLWTPWSEPTRATNPEIVTRVRYCNEPMPSNGGLKCEGDDTDSKLIYHPIHGNWGDWSDWSEKRTNVDTVYRTRNCSNPEPQHGGDDCLGNNIDSKPIDLPVNGHWGSWGPYDKPTGLLNPEPITRKRECDSPRPANGGLMCEGDDTETVYINRPIDGAWSDWGEWLQISQLTEWKRTRSCNNPLPLYGGKICAGLDEERKTLEPVNGGWTEWTNWSEPTRRSNPEELSRYRYCSNPTPENGGEPCSGPERETRTINNPIDGCWGPWSSWSEPTEGTTEVTRTRFCNNPSPQYEGKNCEGPQEEHKNVKVLTNGGWSEWSEWSQPTELTNPEILIRRRYCNNPTPSNGGSNCEGPYDDTINYARPIDGGWTEWSEWSLPTGLTNPEILTKTRSCTNPRPEYNGKLCDGPDENTKELTRPIHGNWGPWGHWSCPMVTKIPEIYARVRSCNNPAPMYGGLRCVGNDTETKRVPKPINGNWGEWGAWSTPTNRTNPETLARMRTCDNPVPLYGGKGCKGSNKDTKKITRPVNGGWALWGPWDIPSEWNLPQTVKRTRTCTRPKPDFDGRPCTGPDQETKVITERTPVNGGWSAWSQWSTPTGLLNPETINRTRACNNPQPMFNGKDCVGPNIEYENITRPIDGVWGEWGPWSEPTKLSNPENLTRTRQCNSPAPLYGGLNCVGPNTDTKPYTTLSSRMYVGLLTKYEKFAIASTEKHHREHFQTAINGEWTDWTEWSTPTHMTNPETLTRTRTCTSPAPEFGGLGCDGSPVDTQELTRPIDGGWSSWSQWSTPSRQTPIETIFRTRECDSPRSAFDGRDCDGDKRELLNITNPIDGHWGEWSEWDAYIPVPGQADRKISRRTRSCNSPTPEFGGKECEGKDFEEDVKVKNSPKPIDGVWSDWSEWSKPTGLENPETITSVRTCTNPSPAFGGKMCEGDNQQSKLIYNAVHGRWGDWSGWAKQNADGHNEIMRTRACDSPAPAYGGDDCVGSSVEVNQLEDDKPKPVDGLWGEWMDWIIEPSPDNPTSKTRYRACDNPAPSFGGVICEGPSSETQPHYKPVDGGWTEWSDWSKPTGEATPEYVKRTRTCTNPAPQYEGKDCMGDKEESAPVVPEFHLPVDGGWSLWGEWSVPIGVTPSETLTRARICDNPTPANGGNPCYGSGIDFKDIKNPINGNWGEWGEWSTPTKLVNPEIIKRTRLCDSPAQMNGGWDCYGNDTETKETTSPVDGGWSEWSDVTNDVELGVQKRTRTCSNPFPAFDGQDCIGEPVEIIGNMEELPQPIDGDWTSWSEWTSIEKTDKTETFKKERSCNNPTPLFGGKECEGEPIITVTIDLPIDGGWTEWTDWSVPTDTSVPQTITRTRTCTNPVPNNEGKDCEGPPTDYREFTPDKPLQQMHRSFFRDFTFSNSNRRNYVLNNNVAIDGGWSDWSDWEDEDLSHQIRTRTCTNPIPVYGGKNCEGPNSQEKKIKICPPDYTYNPESKKCYKLIKKRLSWEGARSACKRINPDAHLVIIDDQTSQNAIAKFFNSDNGTLREKCSDPSGTTLNVWTAGKRLINQANNKFLWLPDNDREPREMRYSNWEVSYPEEKAGVEQCTFFKLPDFKWIEGPCGCQKPEEKDASLDSSEDEDEEEEEIGPDGKKKHKHKTKKWRKNIIFGGKASHDEKSQSTSWSYDSHDITTEVEATEDWEAWSEWAQQGDGCMKRKRTCKKEAKGGKCSGKSEQKKRRKTWRVDGSWEISNDGSRDAGPEVADDWEQWSEWTKDGNLKVWIRTRKCKDVNKNCRGRSMQKKRKVRRTRTIRKWTVTKTHTDESGSESLDSQHRSHGSKSDNSHSEEHGEHSKEHSKEHGEHSKEHGEHSKEHSKSDESKSHGSHDKSHSSGSHSQEHEDHETTHIDESTDKEDWSVDGSEIPDNLEDAPEDVEQWAEWALEMDGTWCRKRTCKRKDKNCKGRLIQKRRKRMWKIIGSWSIDESGDSNLEVAEEWETWTEWVKGSEGWWRRTRKCKNKAANSKCRGSSKQTKRVRGWKKTRVFRKKTWQKTIQNSDWSLDKENNIFQNGREEFPEDWNLWGEWTQDDENSFTRVRTCKNIGPDAKCRGQKKQRRIRKVTKYDIEISSDLDSDFNVEKSQDISWSLDSTDDSALEVPDDWEQWVTWSSDQNGCVLRTRSCKNTQCRGKNKQRKCKKTKRIQGMWNIYETQEGEEVSKDWETWSEWKFDKRGFDVRTRNCKNAESSGKCRGARKQKRKLIKDMNWKLTGDWSLDESDDKSEKLEDWELWGEWTKTDDIWWSRKRFCRNKVNNGKCRGQSIQKRRLRVWKTVGSWSIDITKGSWSADESANDWKTWTEWTLQETDNCWLRTRECKVANCKGAALQRRRNRTFSVSTGAREDQSSKVTKSQEHDEKITSKRKTRRKSWNKFKTVSTRGEENFEKHDLDMLIGGGYNKYSVASDDKESFVFDGTGFVRKELSGDVNIHVKSDESSRNGDKKVHGGSHDKVGFGMGMGAIVGKNSRSGDKNVHGGSHDKVGFGMGMGAGVGKSSGSGDKKVHGGSHDKFGFGMGMEVKVGKSSSSGDKNVHGGSHDKVGFGMGMGAGVGKSSGSGDKKVHGGSHDKFGFGMGMEVRVGKSSGSGDKNVHGGSHDKVGFGMGMEIGRNGQNKDKNVHGGKSGSQDQSGMVYAFGKSSQSKDKKGHIEDGINMMSKQMEQIVQKNDQDKNIKKQVGNAQIGQNNDDRDNGRNDKNQQKSLNIQEAGQRTQIQDMGHSVQMFDTKGQNNDKKDSGKNDDKKDNGKNDKGRPAQDDKANKRGRSKRSASSVDSKKGGAKKQAPKPFYDPICGINMCALCELDLV